MQGDVGDTISITSNDFRRVLKLNHLPRRVAIPEPSSGAIEVQGLQAEGGAISISLLSGTQPIALPVMPVGTAVRIEVVPVQGLNASMPIGIGTVQQPVAQE